MDPDAVERKLAAIMFTDIVGYTTLMAESEEKGLRARERHRELVRPLVEKYHGESIEARGDESLSVFPSALDAVNCAIAIQNQLQKDADLKLHLGIHLGDIVVQGGEVSGDGVNIASRICSLSVGGGLCVSGEVYHSVRNQPNIDATPLGDHELKNVGRPVAVYALGLEDGIKGRRHPARKKSRLKVALATFAGLILLVGVGLWASWPRPLGLLIDILGVSGPPVNPALPEKPSIAVLPFTNMSADPEQEYFSDGITEDLTTALAGTPLLFVISRNSAFTYKGKAVKVEDVGRELGVRYVLEGSVRKAGDRVRITAQLIDAITGGHLWSRRYDRDLSDIFALQSEIAEEILVAVGVEIGAAEAQRLARKPTESLTAVDAMWKGSYHLNRLTRKDNEEAVLLFERAIELDPSFAIAHAFLGTAYGVRRAAGWSSDANLLDRAEELGRRAIELDPSGAFGYDTIAWVNLYRGNTAEALAAAERAIERAPNYEFAHAARGLALAADGRFLEATRSIRQALRLNPRAPTALLVSVAWVNYLVGRREEAVEMWERVREASPDLIGALIPLAAHYEQEGQHDRASGVVEEILRVRADYTVQEDLDRLPGLKRAVGSEEFAQFTDALRKAGLP